METNTNLLEAAENSTVVRQLRELTTWIGDGRKLTQTGRITPGDARALVDILGTEDRVDPEIGGKVFKTTSSEELRGLIRIVEWAKAAGHLRTVKSRIVPVKKNLAVLNKPLEFWELAFDAFDQLDEAMARAHPRTAVESVGTSTCGTYSPIQRTRSTKTCWTGWDSSNQRSSIRWSSTSLR
jgi:hypothetical protein